VEVRSDHPVYLYVSRLIDLLIVLLVGAGVFAEVRRGLFFALTDIFRIVGGVAAGLTAYSFCHHLFHTYTAGFIGLGVAALAVVTLVPLLLRRSKLDPAWGRTAAGRIGAGLVGLAIGLVTAAALVPAMGRGGTGRDAVLQARLARPFLEVLPAPYYFADALRLDLPMLNTRAVRFEDEGVAGQAAFVERVNYSRLNGATCIACGTPVRFDGYFRVGTSVSPHFTCPNCGRTSDGCQTFEGFHRMYGRCPVVNAESLGPIDCGVWTNGRAVYPRGVCPVCGERTELR
jgi:hypothetical protein